MSNPSRMTMSSTMGPGGTPAARITLDLPVEFLSHYEILDSLGKGGMGEVFRAKDLDHDREVAIKFCVAHGVPGARERFEQEAALMARIKHPHVLSILATGTVEKVPYLVMPVLAGKNLRDVLKAKSRLAPAEASRLMDQVLDALDAAHNVGVIHRDLKPENIVVQNDGNAMVLDLGVAKSWADGSAAQEGAAITGTPAYMPPEQCKGLPTGVAADLYAAGVILFEMLAGHPPFTAPTPRQVMKLHIEAPIPRVSESCPGLDGSWDHLLAKALAKSVSDRFADAKAFRMAITKASAGQFSATSLAVRGLEKRSLAAMSQSKTAMAIGTALIAGLVAVAVNAVRTNDFAVVISALMPLVALFFHEEPGRFKELSARAGARWVVYGATAIVVGVMVWAAKHSPDIVDYLMYWVIATIQLGWFGGYHDRDPADRQGIELHRRANVLVAGITMWLLSHSGAWAVKALGLTTMAFAILGALRPPTKTRHLSIGAATTMILMPHLMQDAIEQEVAAAKLPQQPAQPTRIRNKTSIGMVGERSGDSTVPQLKPKEGDTVSS